MSNLKLNDLLPGNVKFFPAAVDDFLSLDKGRQIKVIKALQKISTAPNHFGKPLENQIGRPLSSFRSIYVDKKAIRILWKVANSGEIEVAIVAGIAEREGFLAYELAAKRLQDMETFIYKVLNELKE